MKIKIISIWIFFLFLFGSISSFAEYIEKEENDKTNTSDITNLPRNYVLVDTGQNTCYDNSDEISCPGKGESFYGQDSQYFGAQPSYQNNGDGTVTDLNTGLMW